MNESPTPILDREAAVPLPLAAPAGQPKPRRIKTILFFVLVAGGLLVAVLDSSPINLFHRKAQGLVTLWVGVVACVLLFLTVIAIHELGHVIAGLCMGFRFLSVRVWSLQIKSGFRLTVADNPSSEYAGLAQMLPVGSRALRARVVVMTLGGPAANLLTSFVLALYVRTLPLAGWVMVLSAFIGITNLLPFKKGKSITDGKRVLMLFSRNPSNKRRLALMKVAADVVKGRAPAEIDPVLISTSTMISDRSSQTFVAHWIAYTARWETVQDSELSRLLEICLQNCDFAPAALRDSVFADAGAFQATKRKNVALATQWLNDLPEKPSTPWARVWVEIAILESQEEFPGALRKLDDIELMYKQHNVRKTNFEKIGRWRTKLLEQAEKQKLTSNPLTIVAQSQKAADGA